MNKVKVNDSDTPKMRDERTFHNIALVVMILLAIYCIVPFVLMLSTSLSSEAALTKYGYSFWPREWSFAAYDYLWAKRITIGRCYLITIIVTVVGTVTNLILTSLFAYPLSRQDFKQRNTHTIKASSTTRMAASSPVTIRRQERTGLIGCIRVLLKDFSPSEIRQSVKKRYFPHYHDHRTMAYHTSKGASLQPKMTGRLSILFHFEKDS